MGGVVGGGDDPGGGVAHSDIEGLAAPHHVVQGPDVEVVDVRFVS
jgi:hypothetical protein